MYTVDDLESMMMSPTKTTERHKNCEELLKVEMSYLAKLKTIVTVSSSNLNIFSTIIKTLFFSDFQRAAGKSRSVWQSVADTDGYQDYFR